MSGQGRLHREGPGKLDLEGRGGMHHVEKTGEAIRKLCKPPGGEMKKYTSP